MLKSAYGAGVDPDRVAKGLGTIARALNENQRTRATIGALLLELPDLDWASAARLAHADDALAKFNPNEPRDEKGRWIANITLSTPASSRHGLPPKLSHSPLRLVSARPQDELDGNATHADALQAALDAQPWAGLPPGNRVDELGDLLEWVANAKPEEAPAIRGEIRRLYYDHGDTTGGNALNLALSDALEATSLAERADILERFEPYTREDPAQAATDANGLVSGILLGPFAHAPASAPIESPIAAKPGARNLPPLSPSEFWDELPPIERGRRIHDARSTELPFNFPVIDILVGTRVISTKTIDLRAATYQSDTRLLRRVNGYVDLLANFNGAKLGNYVVNAEDFTERELELVIPRGSWTSSQKDVLVSARTRARQRGVYLTVKHY